MIVSFVIVTSFEIKNVRNFKTIHWNYFFWRTRKKKGKYNRKFHGLHHRQRL